jgi:hypothetical protein
MVEDASPVSIRQCGGGEAGWDGGDVGDRVGCYARLLLLHTDTTFTIACFDVVELSSAVQSKV